MPTTKQDQSQQVAARVDNSLLNAWVSVVLIPVFLLIAVVLTLSTYELFGYKPENANAPLWVDLAASLVTIVVFLVPCLAAVLFGRRAYDAGNRKGLVPLVIGAVAGLAVVIITFISIIVAAVT
jgi:hypothetical protein